MRKNDILENWKNIYVQQTTQWLEHGEENSEPWFPLDHPTSKWNRELSTETMTTQYSNSLAGLPREEAIEKVREYREALTAFREWESDQA